ncbi:sulfatase [Oceaniferula spumae]|uniref:Sulfatase n=1 Tax=Oceaniferula spumae TaxID=2979115 RepID=A0AAT9FJN3_9BACT
MENSFTESPLSKSRRQFLLNTGMGLGSAALASLVPQVGAATGRSGCHHRPRAKRVIFLFMAGAPSQLDLFDYKPDLHKLFKTELPKSISQGQRVTAMTKGQKQLVVPSKFKFSQQGKSGLWMSELLPHLSTVADDLCMIHSLNTNAINHDPGKTSFCTGSEIPGKPSMGSWLSYGLGSLNKNLPDYVVMPSARWSGKVNVQALYARLWGSGFLPSQHQGTSFQSTGDPVLFLSNPTGVSASVRRRMLDTLDEVNRKHFSEVGDPEIQTTISQQEMAFRMQSSVPELTDVSKEPKEVLEMYGPEVNKPGSYASNCLLARRMAERDVRFIQLFHRGWDHHTRLPENIQGQCNDVDQATTGLLKDLKMRGLLEDTLVVFAGEFGRTVYGQGNITPENYGRDHHPRCFSGWMAGGGVKGGMSFGKTDDFSYNVVEDPVHVRDLHATMLHLLGLDHNRLIFPHQGLDQKLTGVDPARVVKEIIA